MNYWEKLEAIHREVHEIRRLLAKLVKQEDRIMIDLTAITKSVADQKTVDDSIIALLDNVVAALAAIPTSNDPVTQAAIDALQKTLDENNAEISAAVLKDTPAATSGSTV